MASPRRIRWTGPALNDLRSIRNHVTAEGRPAAAKRLAERIRVAVLRLQDHPRSGRPVPEFRGAGSPEGGQIGRYREVIVNSYRIIYELSENMVIVLRIWHGRRDLTQLER